MRHFLQFGAVLILLCAAGAWYFVRQPQVAVADGKGWDGVTYHQMYRHFSEGKTQSVYDAPFNKRVGLPWLASCLPSEETQAFRTINIGCGLVACLLIYFTLSRRFAAGVVFACLLPAICYVYSPLRFPNFYPYTVDPPAFLLYALAAFLISRRSYLFAGLVLASSVIFRESGVYLTLALGGALWLFDRRLRPVGLAICLMAVSGAFAVLLIQLPGGPYSQVITALFFVKHKLLEPVELLRAAVCLGMTLASFLLCRARRRSDAAPCRDEATFLAKVFLLLGVAMALFGGTDTTRILFLGYPLYVLILAAWVSESDGTTVAFAVAAGMIANRFLEMIPQPAAPMPNQDVIGLFAFTPDYAHPGLVAVSAVFWACWWFVLVGPGRPIIDAVVGLFVRRGAVFPR